MEFFKIVEITSSEAELWKSLSLQNIEQFCPCIFPLGKGDEICKIGGIWGEFTLRRDEIMGGVRYSMLDCPNALAWTITTGYPPVREKVIIHLTINRERKAPEFLEEIRDFLEEMEEGLKALLNQAN